MENKINACIVSVLICAILTSCGASKVEFCIQWADVWKTLGLVSLGVVIAVVILLWLLRNFKPY